MYPEIHVGSLFHVATWGVFANAAGLLEAAVAVWEARWRKLPREIVLQQWLWGALGAFAGAHLFFLAFYSTRPPTWGEALNIFSGTAVQGAFLGWPLASALFLTLRGQPVWRYFDAWAPALSLAHAVGRLGCLAAGCCYGRPTRWPIGLALASSRAGAPIGVPLHPAQLYEAALDALLAVFLHRRLKEGRGPDGRVWWEYVLGYGAIRFLVQFFRGDEPPLGSWGVTGSQCAALGMLLVGALCARREMPLTRVVSGDIL